MKIALTLTSTSSACISRTRRPFSKGRSASSHSDGYIMPQWCLLELLAVSSLIFAFSFRSAHLLRSRVQNPCLQVSFLHIRGEHLRKTLISHSTCLICPYLCLVSLFAGSMDQCMSSLILIFWDHWFVLHLSLCPNGCLSSRARRLASPHVCFDHSSFFLDATVSTFCLHTQPLVVRSGCWVWHLSSDHG